MSKKMVYCQPTDCDTCPYPDCIGSFRKKPGRKPISEEERIEHRRAYQRKYYLANKERLNKMNKENYYAKKNR